MLEEILRDLQFRLTELQEQINNARIEMEEAKVKYDFFASEYNQHAWGKKSKVFMKLMNIRDVLKDTERDLAKVQEKYRETVDPMEELIL